MVSSYMPYVSHNSSSSCIDSDLAELAIAKIAKKFFVFIIFLFLLYICESAPFQMLDILLLLTFSERPGLIKSGRLQLRAICLEVYAIFIAHIIVYTAQVCVGLLGSARICALALALRLDCRRCKFLKHHSDF